MFQTNSSKNGVLKEEDMHIFIIDSNNLKKSIQFFEHKLKKRTRISKEFWFVDISALGSIDNAELMLNNLPLDIDDDIFLYMFSNNDMAKIWEVYKLVPEKDLVVRELGMWTRQIGLDMTTLEKWQRRGDLKVILMSGSSHFNRLLNVEIGVEFKYLFTSLPFQKKEENG